MVVPEAKSTIYLGALETGAHGKTADWTARGLGQQTGVKRQLIMNWIYLQAGKEAEQMNYAIGCPYGLMIGIV